MEISPIVNNCLIGIDVVYTSNLSKMLAGANLNPGTQINPADYVASVGNVISLPKMISERRDYKGFSTKDIRVGDKCIIRYDVVFKFHDTDDGSKKFKNYFWYNRKDYWAASIDKIFGVIRDGQIIMINGYCMVEDMEKKSLIVTNAETKKKTTAVSAILTGIGNNLTYLPNIKAQRGDRVYYNPTLVQTYKIGSKEFGIISQKHILGAEKDLPLLN